MKRLLMIVLLFSIIILKCESVERNKHDTTECKKYLGNTFSHDEVERLCSKGSIGPAICASDAKQELNLRNFNDILNICSNAISSNPVQCRLALTSKDRAMYGDDLCGTSESIVPAECWKALIAFKGVHAISKNKILEFCSDMNTDASRAAVSCVVTSQKTKLLSANDALIPCKNSMGDGTRCMNCIDYFARVPRSSSSSSSRSMSEVQSLSALDSVRFCADSQSHAPEKCYEASANNNHYHNSYDGFTNNHLNKRKNKSSSSNNNKEDGVDWYLPLTTTSLVLSPSQRAELCLAETSTAAAFAAGYDVPNTMSSSSNSNIVDLNIDDNDKEMILVRGPALCLAHLYGGDLQSLQESKIRMLEENSGSSSDENDNIHVDVNGNAFNSPASDKDEDLNYNKNKNKKNKYIDSNINSDSNGSKKKKNVPISLSSAISLCQGAAGIGPSRCYTDSVGLGDEADRVLLCQGATGVAPSLCLRRSKTVFKSERTAGRTGLSSTEAEVDVLRWALCSGASSVAPADCVQTAPHYLGNEEKLQLCSNAEEGKADVPSKCIHRVSEIFKRFQSAPNKALGYFLANLLKEEERISRSLMIDMCSYASTWNPILAADCLMHSPRTMVLDDAVRMCTDVHSRSRYAYAQLQMHMQMRASNSSRNIDDTSKDSSSSSSKSNKKQKKYRNTVKNNNNIHDNQGYTYSSSSSSSSSSDTVYEDIPLPITMCGRLLPRDWTPAELAALCGNVVASMDSSNGESHVIHAGIKNKFTNKYNNMNSNINTNTYEEALPIGAQVDAVVSCIKGVMGGVGSGSGRKLGWGVKLSRQEAISLCSLEKIHSPVLTCAITAVQTTSRRSKKLKTDLLVEVCAGMVARRSAIEAIEAAKADVSKEKERASSVGLCLGKLVIDIIGSTSDDIAPGIAGRVCTSDVPVARVACLKAQRSLKLVLSIDDAIYCSQEERRVTTAKAKFIWGEGNSQSVIAGRRFALEVILYDQWEQRFDTSGMIAEANIDESNSQGAILWGIRSNTTDATGRLVLDQLIVSQPGTVKLKIFTPTPTINDINTKGKGNKNSKNSNKNYVKKDPWENLYTNDIVRVHVASLLMLVRRDRDAPDPAPCLFLFKDAMCVNTEHGKEDWEALHPIVRGKLPLSPSSWAMAMACTDVWSNWHITVHHVPSSFSSTTNNLGFSGGVWFEHRAGIDAIWTGHSFPTLEMTAMERLGLVKEWASKEDIRDGIRSQQQQQKQQQEEEVTVRAKKEEEAKQNLLQEHNEKEEKEEQQRKQPKQQKQEEEQEQESPSTSTTVNINVNESVPTQLAVEEDQHEHDPLNHTNSTTSTTATSNDTGTATSTGVDPELLPPQQQPPLPPQNRTSSRSRRSSSSSSSSSSSQTKSASRRRNQIAKELRRAYYKQSLLWHPDRWASMPLYTAAVSGAFQLITDAYTQLNNYLNEAVEEVEAEEIPTESSSSSSSSAGRGRGRGSGRETLNQDEAAYA